MKNKFTEFADNYTKIREFKSLLEKHATLNLPNHIEGIELLDTVLTTLKININARDGNGDSLLHYALAKNDHEMIDFLLQHPEIDITNENNDNQNSLRIAIIEANYSFYKKIKDKFGVNFVDKEGFTLLHYIVNFNSFGKKHDLNAVTNLFQDFLSDKDCNPNIIDKSGSTPLHYISLYKEFDFLKLLLLNPKVDPFTQNNDGLTAEDFLKINDINFYNRVKDLFDQKSVQWAQRSELTVDEVDIIGGSSEENNNDNVDLVDKC